MKQEFLFSSFPFIAGNEITLSQIYSSDAKKIEELIKTTKYAKYSANNFLRLTQEAFKARAYIFLGAYQKSDLTKLLGIVKLGDFNQQLSAMSIDLFLGSDATEEMTSLILSTTVSHLFEIVKVNRVYSTLNFEKPMFEEALSDCGFVKEGVLRQGYYDSEFGVLSPVTYSMIKSDYAQSMGTSLVIKDGDFCLTKMTEDDFSVLTEWFDDYKLTRMFCEEGEFLNFPQIVQKFSPYIESKSEILSFIIKNQEDFLGYIQLDPIKDELKHYHLKSNDKAYTVKMFIANEKMRDKGYGSHALNILSHYMFKKGMATAFAVGIEKENTQAVSAFVRAGFEKQSSHFSDETVLLHKLL